METTRLTRRYFLRLSTLAGGAAVLAACAPPKPPEPTKAPEGQPTQGPVEATQAPSAVPAESKPVALSLLLVDWNEDSRKLIDETTVPKFQEQHPRWTVTVDYTDWGQLDAKVMTAFAGGLAPDLFQADFVEFGPKYNTKGIVAELDQLIDATEGGRDKIADFYEKAIVEGCSFKGKIVALPYVLDNRALFYRKDFLNEAGLDPEKAPATWEEFRAAAIAQTIREGDTFKRAGWWGNSGQFCFQIYVQFLWQNGGKILSDAGDKVAFDTPEALEALEFWTKLVRDDKVCPVEGMQATGDMSAMTEGLLAMGFDNYGQLQNVQKYAPDLMDSQGVAVMSQKQKASLWYANCYILTKGPRMQEAWALLDALVLDDDNFRGYQEAMGGCPPRKSITATAKHITPLYKILIEDVMAAPGSHTTPNVPYTMEVLERIDEACQKALYGNATPKEALDQAVQEGNQIIERNLKGS